MTLTHVDGKAIIERQPARYTKLNAPSDQVQPGTVVSSAMELLLDDGSTRFMCSHKNAPECEYTNANLNSITSHQRTHSDRMMAKRAREDAAVKQAELDAIKEKQAQQFKNRSDGVKKAHETRKSRALQTPSEVGGTGNGTAATKGNPSASVIGDTDLAKKAQQVVIAYNALQDAHDQFQNVFLGYMRAAQVASMQPAIDPQILAKAKQYDIIQSALKGMN